MTKGTRLAYRRRSDRERVGSREGEGEGCPSHKGECIWSELMFWDVRQRQFGQCFGRHETGASGHSLL